MADGGAHLIRAPQVMVSGRAIEKETERLLKEWELIAPDAYKHWGAYCDARKRTMREKGMTKTGEMMCLAVTPDYIYYGIGRFLNEPDWPRRHPDALKAVWRAMPCNRMNGNSSPLCNADKVLRK